MNFKYYSYWSELPVSVDLLFEHCSYDSMFFTREWFETLTATGLEKGQSLSLISVEEKGYVLALLPLVGDNADKESLCHRYTALYSLLIVDENQTEIFACLVNGLNEQSINSLSLSPIGEDDVKLQGFRKALEANGYEYHKKFFFYNWIHRTKQQTFNQYLAERPSQVRNTIKRKRRKLEREQEYNIRLFKGNEVEQGLIDYHAPYTASWKGNEQYLALLNAIAINFSIVDRTRLAVLYINGKAAAAQLWFVVQHKASIFRLAYDKEWKHYSPGSILTAYLMEYVIDIDQVEEIDFLTGNERYKQDWMSERRERFRVLFIKKKKRKDEIGAFMTLIKHLFCKDVHK